jgi:UDP:flavonoid glycosyltransferase YjiC (YdhE family)
MKQIALMTSTPELKITTTTEGNGANGKMRPLRIACCATPFSGHLNPIMSLAEGLVARTNGGGDTKNSNFGQNEVCVVTINFMAKTIESRCEDLGIKLVGLSVGGEFGSAEAMMEADPGPAAFPTLGDRSKPFMEEALDAFQPDVVVSDFVCLASQEYASSRNIPLVINWTGPFITLWSFIRSSVNGDDSRFYFSAGGLFISYVRITMVGTWIWASGGCLAERIRRHVNCGNSLVLVNSFWGFERPHYLFHPNIVCVGPIQKILPKSPDFSNLHPELHSFLHTARANKQKVFMVTTGTMVQMEKWMVVLLWEAFETLSSDHATTIVWGMREQQQGFLSDEQLQHPAFHFSTWLPQPALLGSDFVDGVLTHCGWGGTTECILGGKPVVVLPFFADQMGNARLLLKSGCATAVATIPVFNMDNSGHSSYAPGDATSNLGYGPSGLFERVKLRMLKSTLTVEGVAEGCVRILNEPRYKRAAQKLQAISSGPGMGQSFACDLIEHAGNHGLRHLTESGSNSNGSYDEAEDDRPRAATHANHLTGHRPLFFSLAMCAIAGTAAVWAKQVIRTRNR